MSHTGDSHELVGEPAPALAAPNVGSGPDRFDLDALDDGTDAVVLVLMRDYYCTKCKAQADRLADHYEAFHEHDAEVVAVLPEDRDRARGWADVPYPLLADPEKAFAEAYDQPTKYGALGELSDFAGRMPEAVVLDTTGDPEVAYVHQGDGFGDRPSEDELLDVVAEVGS
ncbi:peroxiredoxin family protein [Haloglomus litoreum]|uniref:peroxiredoxin family protein n=1 Tax=Haloglomus litoreum TaxID=3034026 RepID=UPI0023E85E48|nr:redoxin domain-containing protein [Haloglomus sp. DT116]